MNEFESRSASHRTEWIDGGNVGGLEDKALLLSVVIIVGLAHHSPHEGPVPI